MDSTFQTFQQVGDSNEASPSPITVLMRVGENPLIVKKLRYFADKEFAGLFDAA